MTLPTIEAQREFFKNRRKCGVCSKFPGPGKVCEERGRAVYRRSRSCKLYHEMSPADYCTHKDELTEKQRAY